MNKNKNTKKNLQWLSLNEAAEHTPYSAEYLGLLARKKKLPAKKINGIWYTTRAALVSYMDRQMLRNHIQRGATTPLELFLHKPEVHTAQFESLSTIPDLSKKNDSSPRLSPPPSPPAQKHISEQDVTFDAFIKKFIAFLDASTESHFGIAHKIWRGIKRSYAYVIGRPKLFLIAFFLTTALVIAPLRFVFGFFDSAVTTAYNKMKDAQTVLGFRPGTHANEILLLNEKGDVAIIGNVETEGQLRSYVADGIAPIMVKSITKVDNLNVDYLDNVSAEDFTLAFVTKNGNVTQEDVFLEGRVEIGKYLLVKGAARMLSSLRVEGSLGVLGDATFGKTLTVEGPTRLKALLTATDIRARSLDAEGVVGAYDITAKNFLIGDRIAGRVINASDSVSAGNQIDAARVVAKDVLLVEGNATIKGQSTFGGFAMFNAGLQARTGDFELALGTGGGFAAAGDFVLGQSTKEGEATTKNWYITRGGKASFGSLNVSGTSTISNLTVSTCVGCGGDSGWTDDGATVRLTTLSDRVAIGTTSHIGLSQLTVEATSSNATLLSLRSHQAQTADILQVQNASGTAFFMINALGNVGIGTSSPSQLLSVHGGALIAGTTTVSGLIATSSIQIASLIGSTQCAELDTNGFLHGTGAACGSGGGTFSWTPTTNFAQLANSTSTQVWFKGSPISLSASSTSIFEYASTTQLTVSGTTLLANSSGSVGIGTSSPSRLLSVHGNGLLSGNLSVAGLTATGTINLTGLSDGAVSVSNGVLSGGTLSIANGGTNATSFTGDNIVVANSGGTALTSSSTLAVLRGGTGSTTLTGILKGGGVGGIQSAVAGTDYVANVTGDWTGTLDGVDGSGYVQTSRSLTVAGTANQITSSAGAQDLSSNRTWTLSLPNHVIFPSSFQASSASTTNATSTNMDITGLLTFNSVTGDGWTDFCSTITGSSDLCDSNDAIGSGALAWTPTTNFGQLANSTSTQVWLRGSPIALSASSTSIFEYASTTQLTVSGTTLLANSSGSVGIASTSPWGLLSVESVAGTVGTNVPIFVIGDQGTSSPFLYVSGNDGRIGIGTTTPLGTFSIETKNTNTLPFRIDDSGTSTPLFTVDWRGHTSINPASDWSSYAGLFVNSEFSTSTGATCLDFLYGVCAGVRSTPIIDNPPVYNTDAAAFYGFVQTAATPQTLTNAYTFFAETPNKGD